jgi:NTP pyrophosphatase (non-canonical NTP hydrolase)
MSDMRELQKRIIAFRDARDWKQFHNPKDVSISLSLEAAELLEHFQWKSSEEIKLYIANNKDEIANEIVDVLYWILLLAHDLEIDVGKAFDAKMRKNEAKYPIHKSKGSHKKYTEL